MTLTRQECRPWGYCQYCSLSIDIRLSLCAGLYIQALFRFYRFSYRYFSHSSYGIIYLYTLFYTYMLLLHSMSCYYWFFLFSPYGKAASLLVGKYSLHFFRCHAL